MPDPREMHHQLGEIRMFAYPRLPDGWLACDGQLVPVAGHEDLFGHMGTAFGGDGTTTFAMPDLRGRVPVDAGEDIPFASSGGVEEVVLSADHLAAHTHVLKGTRDPARHTSVEGSFPAVIEAGGDVGAYGLLEEELLRSIDPSTITEVGGGKPHTNMAPFSCLSFAVCSVGEWRTHDYPLPPPIPPIDEVYVGEVRMWALAGFVPNGWLPCDGRELEISRQPGLYGFLGRRFGGTSTTFRLPKITGAVPIGAGQGPGLTPRAVGDQGGEERVVLTEEQMPAHRHGLNVSGDSATETDPIGHAFATGTGVRWYGRREGYARNLPEGVLEPAGGGKGHENLQPYLPVPFHISTVGHAPC